MNLEYLKQLWKGRINMEDYTILLQNIKILEKSRQCVFGISIDK
jgi:hypothetical protein